MDRELAAALAGELPAAANIEASDAKLAVLPCPSDGRGATFEVSDGQLTVLVFPPGSLEDIDMTAGGGAQVTVPTSKGEQLLLVSQPSVPGGEVPYESDLSRFATAVAESS